jgi:hypothetical protein
VARIAGRVARDLVIDTLLVGNFGEVVDVTGLHSFPFPAAYNTVTAQELYRCHSFTGKTQLPRVSASFGRPKHLPSIALPGSRVTLLIQVKSAATPRRLWFSR